jgi:hypothetical protein
MPATIEALFIVLVFMVPGFVTIHARDFFLPGGRRPDPLQVTLQSVALSLAYVPLWLVSLPKFLALRAHLLSLMNPSSGGLVPSGQGAWTASGLAILHAVVLPTAVGIVWAMAVWNGWHRRLVAACYRKLNIPTPVEGVGESIWDRLWLNRREQPWLTVYMKDGRVYVGVGIEFGLTAEARELLLGADTRVYDRGGNLIRDLSQARGEGVWIPIGEVTCIEIHR